jgi:hypothetical protein
MIALFAPDNVIPTSVGTLHGRGGPLVTNVRTDCPEPIVTAAVPVPGVFAVIVLAPPPIAIEVTEYPDGTVSETVTGVPWG